MVAVACVTGYREEGVPVSFSATPWTGESLRCMQLVLSSSILLIALYVSFQLSVSKAPTHPVDLRPANHVRWVLINQNLDPGAACHAQNPPQL